MSGMAGNVSAFTTVWTYDIYGALINKNATDEFKVKMGRWVTIIGVVISIGTAYLVMKQQSIMRQILLTSKETQERTPLLRPMIADRALQHRIALFHRIEHGSLGDWTFDLDFDFLTHVCQGSKMLWKFNSDRCSHQ